MDNLRLEAMYDLAKVAVACLQPGQPFRGAFQWADDYGLTGVERRVFCSLFIGCLEEDGRRFVCNREGIIKSDDRNV